MNEDEKILETAWWCHVEGMMVDSTSQIAKTDRFSHWGFLCDGRGDDHVQVAVVLLPIQPEWACTS